jgi:hypothetical protein
MEAEVYPFADVMSDDTEQVKAARNIMETIPGLIIRLILIISPISISEDVLII